MSGFAFRFVALPNDGEDDQFWRDVEASDRLPASSSAAFFLRELCRAKALEEIVPLGNGDDLNALRNRETSLLQDVKTRGYRVGLLGD